MNRSEDRILTTHVGSLVRPAELRTQPAATGAERRRPEPRRLREAVEAVVRRQVEVGLDVVNDGEYGKTSWSAYMLERISGFEIRPQQPKPLAWLGRDRERFPEFFAQQMPSAHSGMPSEVCVGPIEYRGRARIAAEIDNLRHAAELAHPAEVFMTVVAPASTAYNGINEYYASDEEYVFAIAEALREEYLAVHEAGFLVQVDDAVLANMYDELVRRDPAQYRKWAEVRVEALNHALRDIPPERVRYHVCFGSWHVPHVADAPLEAIVDLVLAVDAGAYSIEAANPRHEHEWRVWADKRLPEGRILIPGVVTHHTTTVEHPRLVADRLVRYAKLVGRENVIAGTDCGFAQNEALERVHPEVMWAKLASLVEGARIATAELWGRDAD